MALISGISINIGIDMSKFKDCVKNDDAATLEKKLKEVGLEKGKKFNLTNTDGLQAAVKKAGLSEKIADGMMVHSNLPIEMYTTLLTYASILSRKSALSDEMKDLLFEYSLVEIDRRKFFDFILYSIGDRITQDEIFANVFGHECWQFFVGNKYNSSLEKFLYAGISQSKDNFVLFASFIAAGNIRGDLDWHYVHQFVKAAVKLNLVSVPDILGFAAASISAAM